MVFRSMRLAAAGLLSLSCTFAFADAADRLDAYLAGLDSVSSRFEQRVFDEQRNLLERSNGTFLIDRPGRFRFEYADPPQIIVGDGSRIWIYDPELAQVTVTDMEAALGSTPAVLLTSERPVEDWFRITKLDAREGHRRRSCSSRSARTRCSLASVSRSSAGSFGAWSCSTSSVRPR